MASYWCRETQLQSVQKADEVQEWYLTSVWCSGLACLHFFSLQSSVLAVSCRTCRRKFNQHYWYWWVFVTTLWEKGVLFNHSPCFMIKIWKKKPSAIFSYLLARLTLHRLFCPGFFQMLKWIFKWASDISTERLFQNLIIWKYLLITCVVSSL